MAHRSCGVCFVGGLLRMVNMLQRWASTRHQAQGGAFALQLGGCWCKRKLLVCTLWLKVCLYSQHSYNVHGTCGPTCNPRVAVSLAECQQELQLHDSRSRRLASPSACVGFSAHAQAQCASCSNAILAIITWQALATTLLAHAPLQQGNPAAVSPHSVPHALQECGQSTRHSGQTK